MAGYSQPVSSAAERIPKNPTFVTMREAAIGCQACDLWQSGTQTVFGEGTARQKALNRFIDDLRIVTRHLESESVARSSQ